MDNLVAISLIGFIVFFIIACILACIQAKAIEEQQKYYHSELDRLTKDCRIKQLQQMKEKDTKPIEEMTPNEVRELRKKYCDEFRELVEKFLEERPIIRSVIIYGRNPYSNRGQSVSIGLNRANVIYFVFLKNKEI